MSKILAALLRSERPLASGDLAAEADVSRSSVHRNLSTLEELGLVEETADGYRLQLPFTASEQGRDIVPDPLDDSHTSAPDLLFDVVIDAIGVEDAGRLGDPDDPLGRAFYKPPDFTGLRRELPGLNPWVNVARDLCDDVEPTESAVTFGAPLAQTALGDTGVAWEVPQNEPV